MKCIIIGAGNFNNENIIKNSDDLLICADAGYSYIENTNLKVDILVGDFDSLDEIPTGIDIYKLPMEKDDTDLFVAIQEGIKKGYRVFDIYGALGGRIEHSYANIQILANLAKQGITATLIDQATTIQMLTEGTYIYKDIKGYLSLFSYSEEAIITIKHLKYELNNYKISNLFPLGIDNEFIEEDATIIIHSGMVLSIINKKND